MTLDADGSKSPDPVRRIVSPANGPTVAGAEFGVTRLKESVLAAAWTVKMGIEKVEATSDAKTSIPSFGFS